MYSTLLYRTIVNAANTIPFVYEEAYNFNSVSSRHLVITKQYCFKLFFNLILYHLTHTDKLFNSILNFLKTCKSMNHIAT